MICWLPANSLRGDGLDYPGGFGSTLKHYPMYNEKLIELQKEYAKDFLIHVNPYTGLAYADDPAIITVQINNEESAVKGDMGADMTEQLKSYRAAANGVDIMEIEVTGLNGNRLPGKNKNSYEYEQTAEDWKEADSVWGRYEEENNFPGGVEQLRRMLF